MGVEAWKKPEIAEEGIGADMLDRTPY